MATASSSLSLPISSNLVTVKLNHDNYLIWKLQITAYFRGQNLFGFLDGSSPAPSIDTTDKPTPDFLAWQQQDQAVTSVLLSSLSETLIAHVLSATSSRAIWLILEELFAAKSQARIMQLHYQLATLKKGSDSVAEYYQKAKFLCDTLAAAGKSLPPIEFITYLLTGLGTDFDSLVTCITTRVDPLSSV